MRRQVSIHVLDLWKDKGHTYLALDYCLFLFFFPFVLSLHFPWSLLCILLYNIVFHMIWKRVEWWNSSINIITGDSGRTTPSVRHTKAALIVLSILFLSAFFLFTCWFFITHERLQFLVEVSCDTSKQFLTTFHLWIWSMNTFPSVVKISTHSVKIWWRYSILFFLSRELLNTLSFVRLLYRSNKWYHTVIETKEQY